MLTIGGLVSLIVTLLVFACIVGLLFYIINAVPIAPEYKGWIIVVLKVAVALALIGLLLQFAGFPVLRLN